MQLIGAKRIKRAYTNKNGEYIQTDELELTLINDVNVGKSGVVDGFGFDVVQVYDRFYHNPRFPYEKIEQIAGVKTLEQFQEKFYKKSVQIFYNEWKNVQLLQVVDENG